MSLYAQLQQRAANNQPIRVGLIGAGKFGSMYLAQIPRTPGVHLVGIADLSPDTARANLARVGWKPEQTAAATAQEALRTGATRSEEHTSELQSLMRTSYAVFCLKKKKKIYKQH